MIVLKAICDHYLLLQTKPQFLTYFNPDSLQELGIIVNRQESELFDVSQCPIFRSKGSMQEQFIRGLPEEIQFQIASYLPLPDLIKYLKVFGIRLSKHKSWTHFLIRPQLQSIEYSIKLKFVHQLLPKLHSEGKNKSVNQKKLRISIVHLILETLL